jgi:hypothetical protein
MSSEPAFKMDCCGQDAGSFNRENQAPAVPLLCLRNPIKFIDASLCAE